jgi:hypothetical protein
MATSRSEIPYKNDVLWRWTKTTVDLNFSHPSKSLSLLKQKTLFPRRRNRRHRPPKFTWIHLPLSISLHLIAANF